MVPAMVCAANHRRSQPQPPRRGPTKEQRETDRAKEREGGGSEQPAASDQRNQGRRADGG